MEERRHQSSGVLGVRDEIERRLAEGRPRRDEKATFLGSWAVKSGARVT
jgi:hypothetical protein